MKINFGKKSRTRLFDLILHPNRPTKTEIQKQDNAWEKFVGKKWRIRQ